MSQKSVFGKSIGFWLDSAGQMFMELDKDYNIVFAGNALKVRFGNPEGRKCFSQLAGSEKICRECPVRRVLAGGQKAEAQVIRQDKESRELALHLTAVPIENGDGTVIGAGVLILDITERRQLERLVQLSERRRREFMDQLPDVIFSLDPGGKLVFVNSRARELFGLRDEELLGRPIWDLAAPEDRIVAKTLIDAGPGYIWDREIGVTDSRETNKYVHIRCNALFDEQGSLLGFEGVMRDRTIQRKLEKRIIDYQQSLKESEQHYRSLVEEIPDVLFTLDLTGKFTFLNSQIERLLGYSIRQMLGNPLWKYVVLEDQRRAKSVLKVKPETIWDEEMAILDSEAREKWVRIRCKPLLDSAGTVSGIEGVIRDRTVQRELEKDLKASKRKLLDKMAIIDDLYEHIIQSKEAKAIARHTAEVAHELKQPLAIIGGFALRMSKHLENCDKLDRNSQRECFRIIAREVQRLERILSDLTDFTRKETIELEIVNPHDLIEEVIHLNDEKAREKDLFFELDFGDEVDEVLLDPLRFGHVIRNLIANAVEASPMRGVVGIQTGVFLPSNKARKTGELESETYFEVKIHNRGKTIPPDELEKIFDPFYTTKDNGTGLGLTLSKRIVEEHGGSISVKSNEEGTIFSVWIPLSPAKATMRTSSEIQGVPLH
jgi:PAS domain S-box-containing protein